MAYGPARGGCAATRRRRERRGPRPGGCCPTLLRSEGTAAIFDQLAEFVRDLFIVKVAGQSGRAASDRRGSPAGACGRRTGRVGALAREAERCCAALLRSDGAAAAYGHPAVIIEVPASVQVTSEGRGTPCLRETALPWPVAASQT